jgi:alkylation response protein AidB-like acyl-CoA dehydrogenase
MQTRARKDGSNEVLTGRKIFVTNAPVADVFISYATLDPKLGAAGISNTTFLLLHSANPNGKRAAILSRAR